MNISSLLCTDDPPKKPPLRHSPSPTPSPTISPNSRLQSPPGPPEPVILAPHLRGHHSIYTHQQQRVHPLELPPARERGPDRDLGQHIRKRSFSPDTPRDPSPLRRHAYVADNKDGIVLDTPRSAHSSHSVANLALQQLQQQRQVQLDHMDPTPFSSSAQRSTYAQQRPSSSDMSMGYHSRPSSSHSHSPTLSHFSSAQSPAPTPAPPTSLSRITTTYPFTREGPSPTPLPTPQQRGPGSPLMPFYPSSRPPPPQQHRLSPHSLPHSHSPILHSATPYTYPPVQQHQPTTTVVRPGSSSGSMPTTPYTTQHHHLPHPQQHHPHHLSTSTPASAITVSKQISPYMGLEALVHAASQEQRRINANTGGRAEGNNSNSSSTSSSSRSRHKHRNSLDERRVSSSSPVLDRGAYLATPVSPHRSHHHHPADERRSSGSGYPHPHEAANDTKYATVAEYQREREYDQQQRVGTLIPVPVTHDAADLRPVKRQRMSDPLSWPISGMAGAEERERNFAAHYGGRVEQGQQQQQELPTRLSGPGAHEYAVTDRAILGIDGTVGVSVGDVGDGDNGERSRAAVSEVPVAAAAPLPALPLAQPSKRRASAGSASGPGKARRESSAEVKVLDSDVSEERPQISTSTSSRAQTPLLPVPPHDIKTNQRAKCAQSNKEPKEKDKGQPLTKAKEQDAHEWLLEHYAESTPSPSSTTTPTSSSVTKVRGGEGQSGATLSGSRSSMEPARSRTPAPEIVNALERELELELDDDSGSGSNTNHHHHRHREPDNTDPDVVLEMVVESLDADAGSHDRVAVGSNRVSMEVDEELLSLVDDPAPVSLPPPPPAPRQYAAPPPALRLTKPLTPTVVTVLSPAFPSPGLGPGSPLPPNFASERGSMPPPATTSLTGKGGAETKVDRAEGVSTTTNMKGKKATAHKLAPKQKQPAKPRAKATSKAKAKPSVDGTGSVPATATANKGSKSTPMHAPAIKKPPAASRSRSTSVMPGGNAVSEGDGKITIVEPEKDPEAEDDGEDKDDDKLYCVCKTRYDEDRVMIACDRCDEWYHTQCVNMPDLEVDLVDQFICPLCIDSNPQLHLQTTYKKRCHRGLNHPNPSSPDACHKAARGEFSKYCSDECGVEFMEIKIDAWVKNGGNKEKLWESVRHAERREGVVVCVDPPKDETSGDNKNAKPITQKAMTRVERDLEKLNGELDQVMREREKLKKDMDIVLWRVRLVELATERSEQVEECAWDQRLCFGDEEYAEFGAEVLASYEGNASKEEVSNEGEDAMQVDTAAEDGAWWCRGKKKCERHSGWQKLRAAEVSFEKEVKEAGLLKLTTHEREIRKRIEDLLDPQARNPHTSTPLKPSGRKPAVNGHTKRANGDIVKKGKKKRA